MQYIARPIETLLAAAFLLVMQGVLWPPITYFSKKSARLDASDPISAAMHAALIGFVIVVALVRWRAMREALRSAWLLLLLVALAFLSAFWSDAPELVLRRSTTLAATTLFAVYLAARFELGDLVALLVKLNVIWAVGSFVIAVAAHHLVMSGNVDYPTAWRGVFTAKNVLGSACGFGIIVAVYALWRGYGSRLAAATIIPANLLLLYMSQSKTPLVVLCAAGYVALTAAAFRRRDGAGFMTGFVLLVAGIAGLGALTVGWQDILVLLGRDTTLTGRSDIWETVLEFIGRRPWLGYGYGAFWRNDAVEARAIWGMLFWTVPHAHNAWLEVGLALGIVGMGLVSLLWLAALFRAVRILTLPAARHVVFCLALFVAILVENLTEWEFLRADADLWVMFCVAFVYLGCELTARRAAAGTAVPKPRPAIAVGYPAARPAAQ